MKKIILLEEQVKKVIDKIIKEQSGEISVGTDGSRITNSSLSGFGLIKAATDNFYYSTTTAEIVKQSGGPENGFLSIFKPISDSKTYVDYLKIGDNVLSGQGSQVVDFNTNQQVIASHNGLLLIVRAMRQFKGRPFVTTFSFGKSKTTTDQGRMERETKVTEIDWANALKPPLGVMDLLWLGLSVVDSKTSRPDYKVIIDRANQGGVNLFNKTYPTYMCGLNVGGFADPTKKDEILNVLPKEGFILDFQYDLSKMYNAFNSLKSIEDYDEDGNVNKQKLNKVDEMWNTYSGPLFDYILPIYKRNLLVYVKHYLPNSYVQYEKQINSIVYNNKFNASQWYGKLVQKTGNITKSYGSTTNASVNQQTVQNKTGN
jgi:hypothetical protein